MQDLVDFLSTDWCIAPELFAFALVSLLGAAGFVLVCVDLACVVLVCVVLIALVLIALVLPGVVLIGGVPLLQIKESAFSPIV